MRFVVDHVPLSQIKPGSLTPSDVLYLRGKIGTLDEHSGFIFVPTEFKNYLLDRNLCIRIPDIGEKFCIPDEELVVIQISNTDSESVFKNKPIIVTYVSDGYIMSDTIHDFWELVK